MISKELVNELLKQTYGVKHFAYSNFLIKNEGGNPQYLELGIKFRNDDQLESFLVMVEGANEDA